MAVEISPSILSADFARLAEEMADVERFNVERFHIDVMDGHFVPNLTIGPDVVRHMRKETDKILEVHLMITDPLKYGPIFADAGSDVVLFHIEVAPDPRPVMDAIREKGAKVGLVVNPPTDIESIIPYLAEIDHMLVMSVNPGFSGQKFISSAIEKVRRVRKVAGPDLDIEVDGGINSETAVSCIEAGANVLVAGSFIYGAEDRGVPIAALREAGVKAASSG
ncbi:MAG: ribulose-phosphate 3-epimerase [Planctomycetota bacterium]